MTGTANLLSGLVIKGRECSQCASEDSKAWGEGKRWEASLAGLATPLTGGITVPLPTLDRMEDREGQRDWQDSASESSVGICNEFNS